MQPRGDIMKLGSKPCAVAQLSKINCRDVSSCESIPDVFRGWLAEVKIQFYLYAVLFLSSFPQKKEKLSLTSAVDFLKTFSPKLKLS